MFQSQLENDHIHILLMYIYIHIMSANISSKFENMKYTGQCDMSSITGYADNELNFDATSVSVDSMRIIESPMHDGMGETNSQ